MNKASAFDLKSIEAIDPASVTVSDLLRIIQSMAACIKELREENAELKRRLGLNSTNSGIPPSQDGLNKPTPKSLKKATGKAFGGQKGHKGNTLNHVAAPDEIIDCQVSACEKCDASLDDIAITTIEERQEFDVIVKRHVRAYKKEVKICTCGHTNCGTFPDHIKSHVQFGETAKAVNVALLNNFIPLKRLVDFNKQVFNLSVSETTLMSFYSTCASNLTPLYETIYKTLLTADLKHVDESGLRVKKKLHWIHVLCNRHLTYFCVKENRGFLHEGLTGRVVHDGWKPYFTIPQVSHILCNAHHLRELIALIDFDKESWATQMFKLLSYAHRLWQRTALAFGVQKENPEKNLFSIPFKKVEHINACYDRILKVGEAYHNDRLLANPSGRKNPKKRKGHCLIARLQKYKESVLAFLSDPTIPFTNNEAERPLRPIKGKQKISGCFRTTQGADDFAIVRSAVSSFTKQGKDVMDEIRKAVLGVYPVQDLLPNYQSSA